MPTPTFTPITGIVQNIRPIPGQCCNQLLQLRTETGLITFQLSPETYIAGGRPLRPRMRITAFYDANLPVPLISPPRYQAIVIAPLQAGQQVLLNFFDEDLMAENQSMKLNPGRTTSVTTANGQRFTCNPGDNLLLVFYSNTTRSFPPSTTPDKIIVLC